ncbi:DedA family protein [Falsirhodobacter algicola]|uniref:DedA family protein n=1 Tax=Falsirhodobacter algicola TaxID=2692330 RepID=A0A8J8MU14_9RHOB|nr:DedA family protein [Falsirhodobacter algicola]QUS36293.1 DedA family protein [Falsirhodobacter algicola]
MTETVLALIPDYGLIVVFAVVMLACMAVPVPASVLTLTAGSFAAVGDLSLPMVLLTAFLAFAIGDQIAFLLASRFGRKLLARFADSPRMGPIIARSEDMLNRRGALAVFLSHTIFSPTCPYVTYLSGSGGLAWSRFTAVALPGAAVWTAGYVGLGYAFASQLEQVATLLSNFFGVVLASAVAIGALAVLRKRWATA